MMASAVDTEGTGGNEENIEESLPNKRPRIVDDCEIVDSSCTTRSFWSCSPVAYQVFRPEKQGASNDDFDSETPMEAVQRRILLLQSVREKEHNWSNVVVGRDYDNVCTKAEVCEIRQSRSNFPILCLPLGSGKMNNWLWHDCCKRG
jgi:hypothetical protein